EWADGTVRLAGILPDGSPAPSSGAGQGATAFIYTHNAISQNGSKVFFAAPLSTPKGEVEDEADLYMRDDHGTATSGDDTTRQLNLSERTEPDPNTTQAARFWDATPDGGYVFFTSREALTDDAPISTAAKLYRYDTERPAADPHNLTYLATVGDDEFGPGVAGVSDDGSYVYFSGASSDSASGVAIFVWHDGVARQIGGVGGSDTLYLSLRQWKQPINVRVTPDGTRMVFVTEGTTDPDDLTGYDQAGNCPSGDALVCAEVYFYDATANGGAGELSCVSCNPAATPPAPGADAGFAYRFPSGQNNTSSHINRALSSDGRYVFFSTPERLLDSDTNGVSDAYQYDTVSGELSLLSSGTNSSPSYFIEASPDGRNAFFVTREPLLGRDPDTAFDLYDARVDGGFVEPVVQAPCSGDACRGAVSAVPGAVTPASAGLVGPGNPKRPKPPKPPRCRKHEGKHQKKHCTKKHSQRSATRANRNHGGEK
ncbi:MAG TPA: hypothetical protein VMS11_11965, partial [Solirubrobacterales bacterium]|nr:hypothetical protein [Solirubrobacterales bacterium]